MQFRLHQAEQRSKQESNLITNQAHSVLYGNRKILPIYQKLEQWKESAEQEANKKANWLQMKQRWQRIWNDICYMIENTAHITAYLQRIERMIREKDKPCEKI